MTIAQYRDRETQGARQDLNMLRFQQMPLVPQGGYRQKTEINVRTLSAPFTREATDNNTLREQLKRDKMAAHSRRTALNVADRLKAVLDTAVKFDIATAAKIAGVSYDTMKNNIKTWVKAGLIIDTGEASLTRSALFAKAGYVRPKLYAKEPTTRDLHNKERGKSYSYNRMLAIFGDDKELTSLQIKERTGVVQAAASNVIKTWAKHGFVECVGRTGDAGKMKVWRKIC